MGFGVHFQKMYKIFSHSLSNSPVSFIPHVGKVNEDRLANITKYRADVMKGQVLIQSRGTWPQRSVRVLVNFLHARLMNIEFYSLAFVFSQVLLRITDRLPVKKGGEVVG